jgi:hypothetical protein
MCPSHAACHVSVGASCARCLHMTRALHAPCAPLRHVHVACGVRCCMPGVPVPRRHAGRERAARDGQPRGRRGQVPVVQRAGRCATTTHRNAAAARRNPARCGWAVRLLSPFGLLGSGAGRLLHAIVRVIPSQHGRAALVSACACLPMPACAAFAIGTCSALMRDCAIAGCSGARGGDVAPGTYSARPCSESASQGTLTASGIRQCCQLRVIPPGF